MRPASSARIRPTAMVLVLLAHVPLLLLFLWGWRIARDEPGKSLVFVSLWPQNRDARNVPAQASPRQAAPQRPNAPRESPPPPPVRESPDTAITAPVPATSPSESSRPSIDWRAEATAAAGRAAAPAPPAEFAPPPKALRKPCEKKKWSWEWNEQPKKAGIAPLPYVVLGRCVVGLGFFGCSPQKPPEPNSHLLDDMRDGKTSPSSVPDPDRC